MNLLQKILLGGGKVACPTRVPPPKLSRVDSAPVAANERRNGARLVAVSFATLFFELALIRFINATVQVIAYFNNFLILSAFLGLGFGCLLAAQTRTDWLERFPPIFALVVSIMVVLERFGYSATQSDQIVWAKAAAGPMLPIAFVVIVVFCANFLFFIPLGNELGKALALFDGRLEAYALDLFGSFLGVIAFGIASYLRTSPEVWFTFGAIVVLLLLGARSYRTKGAAVAFFTIAVIASTFSERGLWSPYYKLTFSPYRTKQGTYVGFSIVVDRVRIQDALRFSPDLARTPLGAFIDYYKLPYLIRHANDVLILGGGSGNDATMALAQGARSVTVVEIDPVIVALGYEMHPHRPYRNARVKTVNDDARAFLRRDRNTYDLIVMNALDSHYQLPGLSTLRLESFMYTTDAFRDVRRHMSASSLFVVHLSSTRPWMGERLFWSLSDAFGQEPALFTTRGSPFDSIAFVYGPPDVIDRASRQAGPLLRFDPASFRAKPATIRATDDWPHLYLRSPRLPNVYVLVLSLILAVAVLSFWRVGRLRSREDVHMFLLGAGFMLLETRSITKASLLFGATWFVNAIVISGIILVIFLGNLAVARGLRANRFVLYAALVVLLLIGFAVPINWILSYTLASRTALAAIWLAAPIFFTSLIFSEAFQGTSDVAAAFGANLLGVVVGGVLEYSSMIVGLNALYLIAIAVYVTAAIVQNVNVARSNQTTDSKAV